MTQAASAGLIMGVMPPERMQAEPPGGHPWLSGIHATAVTWRGMYGFSSQTAARSDASDPHRRSVRAIGFGGCGKCQRQKALHQDRLNITRNAGSDRHQQSWPRIDRRAAWRCIRPAGSDRKLATGAAFRDLHRRIDGAGNGQRSLVRLHCATIIDVDHVLSPRILPGVGVGHPL